MHMAIQSCPERAETLYTPAVICHEMWAALGKSRGSLQLRELTVRSCLLTALLGAEETGPSLKGGSQRQVSGFTEVHTLPCSDPLL